MIDATVARRIRLVAFDVDGVLTDGGVYLGAAGGAYLEFKRYDIQDGLGIHFLRTSGMRVAIVTGRVSESVRLRARELAIDDVVQDPDAQKLRGLVEIVTRKGIPLADVAFVGDDFPDLPILRAVGLPVAVANAVPEVRDASRVHLTRGGGQGAVREFAELLLKARNEWDSTTDRYVRERTFTVGAGDFP